MNRAERKRTRQRTLALYAFVTVTLLAATAQMLALSKFNFDEYFTISLVRNSWADIVRLTALDVHPPLYYLAVKAAVTVFGENLFTWHLVSFLSFLGMVFITERFISRVFGEKEACFCVLAVCAVPNMLRYALEARMYSMSMLFITASFYLVWLLSEHYESRPGKKTIRYWVFLALVNVAAAYTHYFAGVAAVGLSLFLLLFLLITRKDYVHTLLQWGAYCVAMALAYLPWMFVMIGQMRSIDGNYWIARINLDTLYGYLDMLFGVQKPMYYGLVIAFFLGSFYLLMKKGKTGRDFWKWGSFFAAGFFLVFGVGYSVLRTPILIDRYLVIVVPMLWISVVLSLLDKKEKWIEIGLLLLFCLCFISNRENLYREYDAVENGEETRCLLENVEESDIFFHVNVQRMVERMAFVPDVRHLLLEGSDAREAFHYWPEMTGCEKVADAAEVITMAREQGAVVWCEDDACLEEFEAAGFSLEEYPAWSVVFYRLWYEE
ncbi:MAG: glycosyltransferase family 39 protein [Acetatifactor sp.]|nr:glycosyltransferase family 39 protein [Acetatifactor sp.]